MSSALLRLAGRHDDQGKELNGHFGAACATWEGLRTSLLEDQYVTTVAQLRRRNFLFPAEPISTTHYGLEHQPEEKTGSVYRAHMQTVARFHVESEARNTRQSAVRRSERRPRPHGACAPRFVGAAGAHNGQWVPSFRPRPAHLSTARPPSCRRLFPTFSSAVSTSARSGPWITVLARHRYSRQRDNFSCLPT